MTPNYLATFRRAVRRLEEGNEKNERDERSLHLISLNSLISCRQSPERASAESGGGMDQAEVQKAKGNEKNERDEIRSNTFAGALAQLERRCPDYIEQDRWQQCVEVARRFVEEWGDIAAALGWVESDLFGLHDPPVNPHPSYSRLARYDATGLIWLLQGRRVIALTNDTAAIAEPSGSVTAYRKT